MARVGISRAAAVAAVTAAAVALAVAFGAAPAISGADPKAPLPDAVLAAEDAIPDAEREAMYMAQLEAAQRARADWITSFEASGQSVVGLPHTTLNVQYAASHPTFAAAVDAAAVIVHATVVDHRYTPQQTYATLRVHDVVKPVGLPAEIEVGIGGGPEPPDSIEGATLAIDETQPFLYVGTEAVLMLEDGALGRYVRGSTGTYLVDADRRVHPHATNPFGAAYDGMALPDLLAALRAEL
jgi:hypothetical protein